MKRSGATPEPEGRRFGRSGKGRSERKSKRKWTPEPGAPAPSWRAPERSEPAPRPANHSDYPETYHYSEAYQEPTYQEPPSRFYDDVPRESYRPTRRYPSDNVAAQNPTAQNLTAQNPTADNAATGIGPIGQSTRHTTTPPYDHQTGARPYPPPSYQSSSYPPRGYAGTAENPAGSESQAETGGNQEAAGTTETPGTIPRLPKKITVTRVAALRSRQLTGQAVGAFQRATRADGAEKSGLTALTYAVMLNYASDAAMMIALANTLFFSPTSTDSSKAKVALYLLITIAPFALVAPVIGPALDKIQRGRRLAMCVSSAGQALMAVVMALHFDDWLLYPAALGMMVLSKSFTVLKAAITPRVVPPDITLSKTNARVTVFGLVAGGVFGLIASGFNGVLGPAGALWFTGAICVAAAVQSMRIPSWVEVTEGEVPTSLLARPERKKKRQPLSRHIVVSLWGNGSVRIVTGFLMMFPAFVVKAEAEGTGLSPFNQLLLLGIVGAAAGIGGFGGNAIGSRMHFGKPAQVILGCVGSALIATVIATILPGLATAAIVGLVGAAASALAKISLDAVIQDDLPEQSRASAFGRSETVLQLAWCFGGAIGLLLPSIYWVGFLVISILVAFGLTQTLLVNKGSSILPILGNTRPLHPESTGAPPRRYGAGESGTDTGLRGEQTRQEGPGRSRFRPTS